MRTSGRLASLVVASAFVALTAACATSPTSPSSAGTSDSSAWNGNINASQTLCVDEVNKYRASVGLPAVSRSTELETFGAQAAEYDGKLGVPHSYFRVTNGGGISKAENELLLWKGYAIDEVIREGIARMWAEGPGGGHYDNLTGPYTQVGCGIWLNGNEVNIGQELR